MHRSYFEFANGNKWAHAQSEGHAQFLMLLEDEISEVVERLDLCCVQRCWEA